MVKLIHIELTFLIRHFLNGVQRESDFRLAVKRSFSRANFAKAKQNSLITICAALCGGMEFLV
jgi:hypothetical protein